MSAPANRTLSTTRATIVAPATAPGQGGIGVVRISGPNSYSIAQEICQLSLQLSPRHAHFTPFYDNTKQLIDEGLCLFFPEPNSFTGEDVVELQGHGGPIVLDQLVKAACKFGARPARPGEFSERAFLNGKIDLAQAEAIADLIASGSEQAAKSALHSLRGVFSQKVRELVEALTHTRIYVEAAIDFPEEEIDFLSDDKVQSQLAKLMMQFETLRKEAKQGALLREGMQIVLVGRPNAGKSSLLNALAGEDQAIVTNIPGTTRDLLKTQIHVHGMPLNITDTAGLRESDDVVEVEGIKRALQAIDQADQILFVLDASSDKDALDLVCKTQGIDLKVFNQMLLVGKVTIVENKIDLTEESPAIENQQASTVVKLSAKEGWGIELLRQHLCDVMGLVENQESQFSARRRHIDAIEQAYQFVKQGEQQLTTLGAGELLAEDLRLAQQHLGEITGEFTSDDLLGRIFSSFCIGK